MSLAVRYHIHASCNRQTAAASLEDILLDAGAARAAAGFKSLL